MPERTADRPALLAGTPMGVFAGYLLDFWQRQILFLDVLRQRGNQYHEQIARKAPSVLDFATGLVVDGSRLPRPVNYRLLHVKPPPGIAIDPKKRPFMIVDPRAGHGPGIGGFKADSEIGVALRAGHACYFASFLPLPEKGQTVLDVVRAEAVFLEHIIAAHPEAEGPPVVIGNCQAGWQVMIGAALRPELFGPIIIPGTPLSYWAGGHGGPPMRYAGGLLGGGWLTAFAGDLGGGLFDGSWLVQNFENLNIANTWWTKQYDLFSHVDTEAPRYLGFERWWNAHVLLDAGEMNWVVENLFVGNRLATGELATGAGERIDLRNIRSPIVVFCSKGDNITPPAQALGWICDLYDDVDDIRSRGQTIVYAVHDSIGHLGIFVSGKVARKEHEEFASNIDFIDVLPPGLYEAEISELPDAGPDANPWLIRFAGRTVDDVRAIVKPDAENERRFGTVRRLSETNLAFYRTLVQPFVRTAVTPLSAEVTRQLHPLRLSCGLFSNRNPFMLPVAIGAQMVRANRHPAPENNPLRAAEAGASARITRMLDAVGKVRDTTAERVFERVYSLPALQGLLGLQPGETPRRHPGVSQEHRALVAMRMAELEAEIGKGGPGEAVLRAILYIGLAGRVADERAFAMLRQFTAEEGESIDIARLKTAVRQQYLMLHIDPEAALAAIPALLARGERSNGELLDKVRRVILAGGEPGKAVRARLARIEALFAAAATPAAPSPPPRAPAPARRARRKVPR